MKVWELMAALAKAPAGADVQVNMAATMSADCTEACFDEPAFQISGGDAEVINANGYSIGYLSSLVSADSEEE